MSSRNKAFVIGVAVGIGLHYAYMQAQNQRPMGGA